MRLEDLPEKNRLANGQLKGPCVGTRWARHDAVYAVEDVSRPMASGNQRVTLIKQYGTGELILTATVGEFWRKVMRDELKLITHLSGIEAVKRAIRS